MTVSHSSHMYILAWPNKPGHETYSEEKWVFGDPLDRLEEIGTDSIGITSSS